MKRNQLLGCIWIIVALLLTSFLIGEMAYNKHDSLLSKLTEAGFADRDDWEGTATTPTQENVLPAEGISFVDLELKSLSISIGKSEDSNIHLDFINGAEKSCTLFQSNGRLTVEEKKKKGTKGQGLNLRLPKSYSGKLSLESVKGDTSLSGIRLSELDIENVSGSLSIQDCEIEALEIESVSGKIQADGSFEQLNVEIVSGSADISSSKELKRKSTIESVSGAITLSIPKDSNYSLQYKSLSGTFSDSITGLNGKKEGNSVHGNGSTQISIETMSGDIIITEAK